VAFCPGRCIQCRNLITANLESMLLPVAGSIEILPDSGTTVAPLVLSSTNKSNGGRLCPQHGCGQPAARFQAVWRGPQPGRAHLRHVQDRLSGWCAAGGTPPAIPSRQRTQGKRNASLKEGTSAAVIVVVADSDLLYDGYYVSQQNLLGFTISNIFNDNLNFMLNSCEMLTGNPALISIRSRGTFERPFTRVQELERRAQDRWLDKEQALVVQVEETNKNCACSNSKRMPPSVPS
jgi:hypothetical protein